MTATAYIQSGAIEAYIFGIASQEDLSLHQQMEATYPEILAARLQMELDLEKAALAQAPTPAAEAAKASLLQTLENEGLLAPAPVVAGGNKPKPTLEPAPKPIRWFRTALAASVLLLMGSIILNFYYWSKYTDYAKRYNVLLVDQNSLLAKTNALQASLKMIKDPGMQSIVLKAMPGQQGMQATVYYGNNEVYLMVNNLPAPAPGKQYQLWAEVDGKMVDAGLLADTGNMMPVKMSTIPQATAFAITLEATGGSKEPTLSAVLVLGKV